MYTENLHTKKYFLYWQSPSKWITELCPDLLFPVCGLWDKAILHTEGRSFQSACRPPFHRLGSIQRYYHCENISRRCRWAPDLHGSRLQFWGGGERPSRHSSRPCACQRHRHHEQPHQVAPASYKKNHITFALAVCLFFFVLLCFFVSTEVWSVLCVWWQSVRFCTLQEILIY